MSSSSVKFHKLKGVSIGSRVISPWAFAIGEEEKALATGVTCRSALSEGVVFRSTLDNMLMYVVLLMERVGLITRRYKLLVGNRIKRNKGQACSGRSNNRYPGMVYLV